MRKVKRIKIKYSQINYVADKIRQAVADLVPTDCPNEYVEEFVDNLSIEVQIKSK